MPAEPCAIKSSNLSSLTSANSPSPSDTSAAKQLSRTCAVPQDASIPEAATPHQWDRKTWGNDIYAHVDILPFCVEDGEVAKHEFAHWLMWNLDIDLLMSWTKSNVFCVTISPKPRRVYLQWGDPKKGEARQTTLMGTHFWKEIYPTLPDNERPKFAPSCTNGAMQWRDQ